jgi:hypothetical protein
MNKDIIPKYLQDELANLVPQKDSYTREDIAQLKRDFEYVLKQREQLKEAEEYGAIPQEEAAITKVVLMVKQFIIQETTKDAVRYLTEKLEQNEEILKELQQEN